MRRKVCEGKERNCLGQQKLEIEESLRLDESEQKKWLTQFWPRAECTLEARRGGGAEEEEE